MRGDLGGGSRGIRRSTCRREREIFFFDMEQHRERDEEEEEENREKRWEADRWAFRPHQRIVHIGTSSQPDRWGLLVSFLVFATKLDNQCSALRVMHNFDGFLCPDVNVVPKLLS